MSLETDLAVLENLETAVMLKNDETTITKFEAINRILSDVEPVNQLHDRLLKTQIKSNKMIVKRLQTGKY